MHHETARMPIFDVMTSLLNIACAGAVAFSGGYLLA